MRDAIVVSGWSWEAFNVPERIALALAHSGARVLYCQNPVSFFRHKGRPFGEIETGVFGFGPEFLGHRLNVIPLVPQLQARIVANQILSNAVRLHLKNPMFLYPHGDGLLPLCREMRKREYFLVHLCMDYPEGKQIEHVRLSDVTLVVPRAVFKILREGFGEKVRLLPQVWSPGPYAAALDGGFLEPSDFSRIPRPRLGYLGNLHRRLSRALLRELLVRHPEWQFFSFGSAKSLDLPNEHVLSWRSPQELRTIVSRLDAGFMPYDCANAKNYHCVPLKTFDYFAQGIPVASTPILHMKEYEELVYFGSTAEELEEAVSAALAEPIDSPKRRKRVAIAEGHSVANISCQLDSILFGRDQNAGDPCRDR